MPSARALIAFDAKINIFDPERRKTALDLVVLYHNGSDLEVLLLLLGALTYRQIVAGEGEEMEEDNGRVKGITPGYWQLIGQLILFLNSKKRRKVIFDRVWLSR